MTYTCSACGTTKTETIIAHGHSCTGAVTTAAACTEDGVKTYSCTYEGCDYSYTETITATGHTVVTDEAVAATCTETGKTEGSHCAMCGTVLVGQSVIKATGHSYSCNVTTPSTESACKKTYTCSACEDTYTETLTGLYTDDNGDTYYLDENGYAVTGLVKTVTDGQVIEYYYFAKDGKACKATDEVTQYTVENGNNLDGLGQYTGIKYTFTEEGVIVHFSDTSINGIYYDSESGNYYFCVDGVIVAWGLVCVDGSYYYARTSTGALVVSNNYWITVTHDLMSEGTYTFDADGKMVNPPVTSSGDEEDEKETLNGIVTDSDGNIYYYVNGEQQLGLQCINGDYYYFRTSTGAAVVNATYWITVTNGLTIPETTYTFDADGKMVNPPVVSDEDEEDEEEPAALNGIVTVDGIVYYYINGVQQYGLQYIDGYYYYFRTSTGAAVVNATYWITVTNGLTIPETTYTFDADGKMVNPPVVSDEDEEDEEEPAVLDGIVTVDGTMYYYIDGVQQYGLQYINGYYYYFRTSNGAAVVGTTYWITVVNGLELKATTYTFDESGHIVF